MTLVPLKPRRLSKPTAKGGSQLNRGKAEFRKKVVAGPSKMPKNFPQLARSEKEGILKMYFDSFGDHWGREGGRAEQWLTDFEVCEVSLLLL